MMSVTHSCIVLWSNSVLALLSAYGGVRTAVLTAGNKPLSGTDISRVKLNDSVRVATVDNFQGEESTIIILSLVRNNK